MEERMTFGDLITSENINDETHVMIRDYLTTKTGKWFEDGIISYHNRAVYCFKVFPYTNEIVVELAGKWNMPDYYKPKYVVMAVLAVDPGESFEYSGEIHIERSAACRELSEAIHDPGIDQAWIKEI